MIGFLAVRGMRTLILFFWNRMPIFHRLDLSLLGRVGIPFFLFVPGGYIPTLETKQRECWKFKTRGVNSEFDSRVSVRPSNHSLFSGTRLHVQRLAVETTWRCQKNPLFV